ncbi:DUF167 domain-containing protein [Knoellia remsis]|uniref:DUF167 domain-containing protein n=1 Tax=Knoellia remsis TaxID=407159 RepID=UPI001FE3A9F8|nr:DUF167 domain-containing protein [Knoellia remsis]
MTVRVKPGASRTAVGGSYGPAGEHGYAGEPALVVAVTERAVDGAATAAVLRAVATAFGVRPRQVTLLSGATSRTKVLEVAVVDETAGRERLAALLTP